MMNLNNRIIILRLFISIVIALAFVFLVNFDLMKSIYDMYYTDSQIGDFFKEQGQNIFTNDVKVTTFKFIISRALYTVIPIAIDVFLLSYYHVKKIPDKYLKSKIFEENPSLANILTVARYLMGGIIFFLIIAFHRTFFYSTFHNCLMGNKIDFIRVYLASFFLLVPIVRWIDLFNDIKTFHIRHKSISVLFYIFIVSLFSCCLVEFQINSKIIGILDYLIHINIMYWIILQLLLFVLFRNVKPGAIISLAFSYIIGLANDIVYQFRGNYIMFGDLTVVRTALEVAGNYDYKPGKWFWISLVVFVISILFVLFTKIFRYETDEKDKNIKKRIITTIIGEIVIVAFVIITFKTGDFYGKVFGVGWDYNENVSVVGYLPYFFSNMDSTRKIVVEGYSSEKVKEYLDGKNISNEENNYPNIILIQNEAFADLSITADIETDIDPMPFIHSMKKNTQKGYLNMSVTAGPTANTEFEILSRSSLQFFPYGSVPYTQYLKQHIPSLVECLKNQSVPYHTVAYHSYYSSGYNRNSVYSFMGFDEKLFENSFLSDYPDSELPRGYLSDEANYRRVIKEYENCSSSDSPFFCFNVTIQGHGGYGGGPYNWDNPVKVTNFSATDSMNTYLSSVRLSDTAFEGLVNYFSKVDEPTIIMMYGDHQPGWDDDAKKLIAKHPAWEDEESQDMSRYYVPYIIWANFDIDEHDYLLDWNEKVKDKLELHLNTLSTNYVGSYLMSQAGVELSEYDKYLLDLHEKIPAITAIGIWDKEGNYYIDATSSDYADILKEQELIQYNLIFDKVDKQNESFLP